MENVKTFSPAGKAHVENVTLPATYSHVFVPVTTSLASNADMHRWLDRYDPNDSSTATPPEDLPNALFAADVWHGIKRHWVMELKTLIRARRAAGGAPRTSGAAMPAVVATPAAIVLPAPAPPR